MTCVTKKPATANIFHQYKEYSISITTKNFPVVEEIKKRLNDLVEFKDNTSPNY